MTATIGEASTASRLTSASSGLIQNATTGFVIMVRFILRRNWLRMLIWLIVLAGMVVLVIDSQRELFPTQAARDAYAQVANTPAIAALTGLPYAAGTLGGILNIKLWMTLAVALALAVIFMVTRNGRTEEEEGHTIGLHANKHISSTFRSYRATKKDFHDSLSVLKELGIRVKFYRPPWGLVNLTSNSFINKYEFEPVLWSIHASDWSRHVDVEHIITVLTTKVKPGDVVLLHDGRGSDEAPKRTIKALETAIPELIRQGYQFVIPHAVYDRPAEEM